LRVGCRVGIHRGGNALLWSDTLLRPSCSRQVATLRLRGSSACGCPKMVWAAGSVWIAEVELPHFAGRRHLLREVRGGKAG
jgi:hypothetical protein